MARIKFSEDKIAGVKQCVGAAQLSSEMKKLMIRSSVPEKKEFLRKTTVPSTSSGEKKAKATVPQYAVVQAVYKKLLRRFPGLVRYYYSRP